MIMASNPKFCLLSAEEALRTVERSFDGWEILAEKNLGWENRGELKDLLSTTDLKVQIHAPLNDLNIASHNPRLRRAALSELERSFEMASMFDAEIVTVHPGIYSPLGRFWDGALKTAKGSLKELDEKGEEFGVTVALENMPQMWVSMCTTPSELSEFIEYSSLEFCFDAGHAYTAGRLTEFLDLDIVPVNVHLHDNKGGDDLHLPLGEGEIDLGKVLKALSEKGYEGNWVIEGRGADELVQSKKVLEDLLSQINI